MQMSVEHTMANWLCCGPATRLWLGLLLAVCILHGAVGQEVVKYTSSGYVANHPDSSPLMSDKYIPRLRKPSAPNPALSQAMLVKDGMDLLESVGKDHSKENIDTAVVPKFDPTYEETTSSALAHGATDALTGDGVETDDKHLIDPQYEVSVSEAAAKGAAEAIEESTGPHAHEATSSTEEGLSVDSDGHLTDRSVDDALAQYSQKFEDVLKEYRETQDNQKSLMEEKDKEIAELEGDVDGEKKKMSQEEIEKAEMDAALKSANADLDSEEWKTKENEEELHKRQEEEKENLKKDLHRLMALKTLDIHLDEKDHEIREKNIALNDEKKHFAEDETEFYGQEKDMMNEIKKWKTTSEELGQARHHLQEELDQKEKKWDRSDHHHLRHVEPAHEEHPKKPFHGNSGDGSALATVHELVKREMKEEKDSDEMKPKVYDEALKDMEKGEDPTEKALLKGLASEGRELNKSLQKLPVEERKKEIHRPARDDHLGDGDKKIVAKYLGGSEHDKRRDRKIEHLNAKVEALEKQVHKTAVAEGQVDHPYTEEDVKRAEKAGEQEQEMVDQIKAAGEAVHDSGSAETKAMADSAAEAAGDDDDDDDSE